MHMLTETLQFGMPNLEKMVTMPDQFWSPLLLKFIIVHELITPTISTLFHNTTLPFPILPSTARNPKSGTQFRKIYICRTLWMQEKWYENVSFSFLCILKFHTNSWKATHVRNKCCPQRFTSIHNWYNKMDKLLTVDFVFIYVNVVCLRNAPHLLVTWNTKRKLGK